MEKELDIGQQQDEDSDVGPRSWDAVTVKVEPMCELTVGDHELHLGEECLGNTLAALLPIKGTHNSNVEDLKTYQSPGPSRSNVMNSGKLGEDNGILSALEMQANKGETNEESHPYVKTHTRRRVKKTYSAEELEVQRHKATERKRRERARIRSDPEALEKCRQNERERQRKRKENGQLKSIKEKGLEEQCRQRMLWRINSHNFYRKVQARNRDI